MLLAYTASPWGTLAEWRELSSCPSRAAVRSACGSGVSRLGRCGSGSGSAPPYAAMAYSTVQRVALASGLVLAVSLLLPKAFLSRGKRPEPPPGPEGERRLGSRGALRRSWPPRPTLFPSVACLTSCHLCLNLELVGFPVLPCICSNLS